MTIFMANIYDIKNFVKKSPRLECIYMCLNALRNIDECKRIVNLKRSPYTIEVRSFGNITTNKWIYCIDFDEGYRFNGFCSLYRFVLLHLAYAEYMNFTPIVRFGNKTLYYDSEIEHTKNAFEYYFEPVSNIAYENIYQYRHVVFSKGADGGAFGNISGYAIQDNEIELLGRICRKYIKLRYDIKKCFEKKLNNIIDGDKTLGVHVRATDFNKGYNRHPVAISPQEYLEITKKIFKKYGFKKVFLATDDENVVKLFEEYFGRNLYYYEDTYRSVDGKAIHYNNENVNRKFHKFLLGLEIIKDFYTLGMCAGIIAGNSNVSMCARIIKASTEKKYIVMKIIDKGINHNFKETRNIWMPMIKKRGR